MIDRRTVIGAGLAVPLLTAAAAPVDVRTFGAKGDGRTLDHDAINRAIVAVARSGGTVLIPAGRYLCFSIRLKSGVTLMLAAGAVIEAADPAHHAGGYDLPEPPSNDVYQDFGHSHFHNSLIWADGVHDVAIVGPGMIDGIGLTREGPGARWKGGGKNAGSHPASMRSVTGTEMRQLEPDRSLMNGRGNKAIALKNARRVRIADLTIARGGHFAILATGCDDVTIEGLRIDTNRDGIDIDACRRVTITNCHVNSPNDDAIVLKASYALGDARPCEDVTITGCSVSGFDPGTLLDGTRRRTQQLAPDRDRVTGRIKLGTESHGGFRRIRIENCRFQRSRGLALETVDGGVLEEVTARNLTMDEVTTAPLFLRTGDRRRGPDGTGLGRIRHVAIANLTATGIDPRFAASIVGLADSPVEDVTLTDLDVRYAGGGTATDAARPVPEARDGYPEPSMFGPLPAYGLYIRHARGITARHVTLSTDMPDARPPVIVEDGRDIVIEGLKASGEPVVRDSKDVRIAKADQG
ncbi:rhamnogalacturonidase [Sphingomonas sp. CFBP 8760]|uniref:rhamnogalacturonidase n=1 Tax=Sphingomonas sp. CFBP 8760 TaxID=2775282 RepID=UPI00177CF45A|nr:glycosyl hydrolase family 28-related protein [Sphingomonas sp. CFBP 8760]MBD8545327.1 right-handed parallel beta-helix repeat-containing protein [Sphingomonas sp. CFBP 8760]